MSRMVAIVMFVIVLGIPTLALSAKSVADAAATSPTYTTGSALHPGGMLSQTNSTFPHLPGENPESHASCVRRYLPLCRGFQNAADRADCALFVQYQLC